MCVRTVNRVTAAAGLARAVADHVPKESGDFGKLDCLDGTNERHASDNLIVEERLARIKPLALAMKGVASRGGDLPADPADTCGWLRMMAIDEVDKVKSALALEVLNKHC
jgi:hypothetical protein